MSFSINGTVAFFLQQVGDFFHHRAIPTDISREMINLGKILEKTRYASPLPCPGHTGFRQGQDIGKILMLSGLCLWESRDGEGSQRLVEGTKRTPLRAKRNMEIQTNILGMKMFPTRRGGIIGDV